MDIPKVVIDKVKSNEIDAVLSKHKHLDYSNQKNYERLCAEYRDARDAKNTTLADKLNDLMYQVQKARPKKDIKTLINERKAERGHAKQNRQKGEKLSSKQKQTNKVITKTKTTNGSKKQRLFDGLPNTAPRSFSFENSLAYYKQKRKCHQAFSAADFATYFNIDLVFAMNLLNLAAKMTILRALSKGKYYRSKITKMDYSQIEKYLKLSKSEVRNTLDSMIAKTGPINYIQAPNPPKKKKIKRLIRDNSATQPYDMSSSQSYILKISGTSVDGTHEVGHGRKKGKEYNDNIALQYSKSRYGLNNKEPILEYDLD